MTITMRKYSFLCLHHAAALYMLEKFKGKQWKSFFNMEMSPTSCPNFKL